MEVGSANVALQALKFYPRALPAKQIEEMFREGQPVVELSTGYILRKVQESEFQSVKAAMEAGCVAVDQAWAMRVWRLG